MSDIKTLSDTKLDALAKLASATSIAEIEALETALLGRKGEVTLLLRQIASVPPEQRREFGQAVNVLKEELASAIEQCRRDLATDEAQLRMQAEAIDVTLPGRGFRMGHSHVLVDTMERIKTIFIGLGYNIVESPEIESYKYNFEALNYPEEHPAMDEQMSFYITNDRLLRTQTTAFQHRVMEKHKPPLKMCTMGKCFRCDAVDATHGHTFHQVDCFAIDHGITMADLKGTLHEFAQGMFGKDVSIRFRPDFFPFVEPGAEIAITCVICDGAGCNVCKGSGWLELGGAGMIHPNVLRNADIDPEEYSGFAFGMGIDRMPMLLYGINDLRLFTENDIRFLRQF